MSSIKECSLCYLKKCSTIDGFQGRVEHIPEMPWILIGKEAIEDCPTFRNPTSENIEKRKFISSIPSHLK